MIYYEIKGDAAQAAEIMSNFKSPSFTRKAFPSRRRHLGRRATVAMLVGMSAAPLAMAVALGIEVSGWTVSKQRLQRTADAAALAAAEASLSGASAQAAATYGAYVAEINGIAGASSRSWSGSSTNTLTDNMITIQMTSGVVNSADTAFVATVQAPASMLFTKMAFPAGATKTISATASAEITAGAGSGGQPCLLTLQDYNSGTTVGYGITITGATTINTSGCTVRSDDGITVQGSSKINTTTATYASGAIYLTGTSSIGPGPSYSSVAQIPDPYANWLPLQNGLTNAAACTGGTAYNLSQAPATSISPGCYSSITVSGVGQLTLRAGVYYVNGNINIGASGSMTGSGVTIFSTGTFTVSGASPVSLVAPNSGTTSGIVYASTSTSTSYFQASGTMSFTGLFYYPKGQVSISGASTQGTTCGELIASSVNISGSSSFSANCTSYGLSPYPSLPGASSVSLVK